MAKEYNTHIIETPTSIEVWRFSQSIQYGFNKTINDKPRRTFEDLKGPEKIESIKRRQKYYTNKRHEIKRLVDCNFDQYTSFLTLTQNQESEIKDSIDRGNLEFQKFVKRLKRWLKKNWPTWKLKYIATWERTKRGMIHYHIILFSFPYIQAKVMEGIWTQGFIKINHINHVQKSQKGLYISKYFAKDLEFKDAKKKAYFKTQNLIKPEEYKFDLPDFDINDFGIPNYQSAYKLKRKIGLELAESDVEYYSITKN